MADKKKDNKSAPKKSNVKVMSKKDCKDTKGGMISSSFVNGGLAGPIDYAP